MSQSIRLPPSNEYNTIQYSSAHGYTKRYALFLIILHAIELTSFLILAAGKQMSVNQPQTAAILTPKKAAVSKLATSTWRWINAAVHYEGVAINDH